MRLCLHLVMVEAFVDPPWLVQLQRHKLLQVRIIAPDSYLVYVRPQFLADYFFQNLASTAEEI